MEAAGNAWNNEHDLVLVQPTGRPLDPSAEHRVWKNLLKTAGVRPARLHDARHTMASLLLAQKVHPRVVMEIMGHSQISLTLGTYSHVAPELSTDAADRMAAALWTTDTNTKNDGDGQDEAQSPHGPWLGTMPDDRVDRNIAGVSRKRLCRTFGGDVV